MSNKSRYLKLSEFGSAIGLSATDKRLISHKNQVIKLLKQVRILKGISQKDLARKLNTQQPAIARMEAGHVGTVSFDFLIKVGMILGISILSIVEKKAA